MLPYIAYMDPMGYNTYSTYRTAEKPLISTYSRKLLYQLPTPMMFDPQLRNVDMVSLK